MNQLKHVIFLRDKNHWIQHPLLFISLKNFLAFYNKGISFLSTRVKYTSFKMAKYWNLVLWDTEWERMLWGPSQCKLAGKKIIRIKKYIIKL